MAHYYFAPNSGVHVDLLFTDVVMPGALKSPEMARQAVQLQPHLKVLFTSGYTQNAIVHAGRLDEGVELLSKPYSRSELAYKVRHVLGSPGKALPSSNEPWRSRRQNSADFLDILVVEDNELAREALCELISMLGHQVVQAETATQAFAEIAKTKFDVLMTDIHLPDMSGLDLAQQASSFSPGLSVIFASGEPVVNDETRSFTSFQLLKPYSFDELQAVLRKVNDEFDLQDSLNPDPSRKA